ncbi:MAG: bifunctional glutamate N-acetyltransferase/amino-acid acetyltransferase ArgJ [Eubacteriales bacterium]|nr:bifunctional glutamate N-acetyltransferase/amino-acid acetyltransferase ArgJ [Eubacteriales bacterium]
MELTEGGVCAAKGFSAGSVHCGIRKSPLKDDLALIVSDTVCQAAAVYTTNKVKAAPLHVTKAHLADGTARAVIANSGNANACAPNGEENAHREAKAAADALGIPEDEIVVASTGVIGVELPIECIEAHAAKIRPAASADGSAAAAKAIMTTDTEPKSCAVSFSAGGKTCHLGGICKGSGMIHPNMGTMLCFLTTDCAITHEVLDAALKSVVKKTFNRVTVDGDTSTNDMCVVLANGAAENNVITSADGPDYEAFCTALLTVCVALAKKIAGDGEGATRLLTCTVTGASDEEKAENLAKSICGSSLVKAAMFGADANWGRVLCAMGYSGAEFDPETVEILFSSSKGDISVCKNGRGLLFSEELAKEILSEDSVEITAKLSEGDASVSCWGCDLTYDYVKINGDYRT